MCEKIPEFFRSIETHFYLERNADWLRKSLVLTDTEKMLKTD